MCTSKAAKERRKERRWLKSGGGSAVAKERRWPVDQLVLMVLDLEVVSLTLKLPEVWGNTSKAGMVLDLEVVSLTLKLEV